MAVFSLCAPALDVDASMRLVAAEPAFGGERGSLPRTVWSFGGGRLMGAVGERGACRRHRAARDRAEGARRMRDGAGAQPRPAPKAGPAAP